MLYLFGSDITEVKNKNFVAKHKEKYLNEIKISLSHIKLIK